MTLDEITRKEIDEGFGEDVLSILDGITKIKRGTDSEDTNPQIIIKYILNTSKDLRPVYLKYMTPYMMFFHLMRSEDKKKQALQSP